MNNNYGLLLDNKTLKLHRSYFEEMSQLLGIKVLYRAPKPGKHYTTYSEIEANYENPIETFVIFQEHINQYTLKKLGWVSELQEDALLLHCIYDLPAIQKGALFIIPSGLDNTQSRIFRVNTMQVSMVYPSSLICEVIPEFTNTFENSAYNFKQTSFNLLTEENDPNMVKDDIFEIDN